MPPRTVFKKEDVLNVAYAIVKKEGFEGLNARRIAKELNSSVHPIFRHFTDMEELKKAVYKKIYAKYQEYMQIEINENKAYKKYLINLKDNNNHIKNETYMTGIYLKRQVNVVKYDTTDITKDERVDYLVEQEENKKIVNQILSQKL